MGFAGAEGFCAFEGLVVVFEGDGEVVFVEEREPVGAASEGGVGEEADFGAFDLGEREHAADGFVGKAFFDEADAWVEGDVVEGNFDWLISLEGIFEPGELRAAVTFGVARVENEEAHLFANGEREVAFVCIALAEVVVEEGGL